MPFPVFDLHCDTADRIAWTSLDKHYHQLAGLDRFDPNIDGGEPDTELKTNGCHLSLDSMATCRGHSASHALSTMSFARRLRRLLSPGYGASC